MTGLSRHNATLLTDRDHLQQSILDILTTPIGSRVLRRDYGSQLPSLIDQPMNGGLRVDIFAATADALGRWEPRFILERVVVDFVEAGRLSLGLFGQDLLGNYLAFEEVVI